MTEQPLVSVICTVYNKAPWLERVIESFLAQEVDFPIEILLIDDASTDGSADIIKRYAHSFPRLIRAYYNEENLGICKTWIKICQEAKGDYIARCDGDDFWLDKQKLAKQVALLQANPQSRWSNTDFDVYDEKGQFVSAAGFENGWIPLADSFEKMLATRGFTMASTWLVERELMLEVNQELDITTADDTFNLQMDLFQRTELAYLPESTVAYTINKGSDSRPRDFQKLEKRFNTLLQVQNTYLDKYPESNYREMLRILLERVNQYELVLTEQEAGLERLGFERVSIFFAQADKKFYQDQALDFPLAETDQIDFILPEAYEYIRVDLSERPSFYQFVRLVSVETGTEIEPEFTNGICLKNHQVLFPIQDPQLIYRLPPTYYGQHFRLEYKGFEVNRLDSVDYIGTRLAQELLDQEYKVESLTNRIAQQQQELLVMEDRLVQKQNELEQLQYQQSAILGSRRWTIPTTLINFFRRIK